MVKKGFGSIIKFHEKKDKVILLIHGFTSSPFILSEYARYLFDHGFSVYCLRLAGHGLKEENIQSFFKTKARDWEIMIENIYLDLTDSFDEVYVFGHSLGGLLALNLASRYPVAKTVASAPFLRYNKGTPTFLISLFHFLPVKFRRWKYDCSIETDLGKHSTQFVNLSIMNEMIRLQSRVRKRLSKVSSNTLCFLAKNDHITEFNSHIGLIQKYPWKLIILEKCFHMIHIDCEKELFFEKSLEFFQN